MKFNNVFMQIVKKDLESNVIPMLLGEPGIGKSSWVEALGELMHTKVFVLPCNQMADKTDLTGARLVPTDDTNTNFAQKFYPHTIIQQAIEYAKANPRETPILFMDELNRTTPDVTSAALSIPTQRSIGDNPLPKNLRIITAGNDKGNITSLDEASISRFSLYHVNPDVETYLNIEPNLNEFIKKVLLSHPECICCKVIRVATAGSDDDDDAVVNIDEILDDGEEMNQIAVPRTISGLSRWLNTFTKQELQAMIADSTTIDGEDVSVLEEAIWGHTGKTAFTQFLMAEIASGIMTMNTQSANVAIGKPQCYDDMKKAPTMTDLDAFIKNLTDNEKSGCLVYALFEKEDNSKYISSLLTNMSNLTPNDIKSLMKLYANDQLDEENKETFLNFNHSISKQFSMLMP